MASEILSVPEEKLFEVIKVIRAGLSHVSVSEETRIQLLKWCEEEEEYISSEEDRNGNNIL